MRRVLAMGVLASLTLAACTPAAPASPTTAPPKPAATTAPAKPAATAAPAKPTEKPAEKPAAKPTEKPAAKAPAFDEKAVADFYRGKTIRMVIGFAPGGATDTNSRMVQKVLGKHIPGNPTVVPENKPGGGGLLVANTVYNSEPKDGTVIAATTQAVILQQAIGAQGVQFDSSKYQWLGSTYETAGACAVRTDVGINSVQEVMGESGKELTVSSFGKGTPSYDPPAVMNAALGTRFKIVTGYDGGASQRLAVKNKEVQGFCTGFDTITSVARDMFEGSNPQARVIIVLGAEPPNHPFGKGVPASEQLAKTEEAKLMMRAADAPSKINFPFAFAPEVPRDRVEALRSAIDKTFADPEYRAAAEKVQQAVQPRTGAQVMQVVQTIMNTPAPILAKLKAALE